MTIYVGGLRDRLIRDSLFYLVKNGLSALGWFNPNPTGYTNPVNMIPEQVPWDEEVPLNSVVVSAGSVTDEEFELGTFSMKNTWDFYVDVYGENDALSMQISGDIRDVLRGQFASLGFSQPTLNVYDYSQPTPPFLFFCDLANVWRDRAENFPHRWQRYLYTVRVQVIDYHGNDQSAFDYGSTP